jgi:hypothetical protein
VDLSDDVILLGALHLAVLLHQVAGCEVQPVSGGKDGDQLLLLALVIQHRDLRRPHGAELLASGAVANGNRDGTLQNDRDTPSIAQHGSTM